MPHRDKYLRNLYTHPEGDKAPKLSKELPDFVSADNPAHLIDLTDPATLYILRHRAERLKDFYEDADEEDSTASGVWTELLWLSTHLYALRARLEIRQMYGKQIFKL